MQTDWGGEYEKLNAFFQKVVITHHVSCPHAHRQNGSAEQKHLQIIEVGIFLLVNASMPLKFWDEAFLTATFLINMLPTKFLNLATPTEKLLILHLIMTHFAFLVVLAGRISVLTTNKSLLSVPNGVCF